ncbi:MAG: pyrroloquinoline quinone biosynthesis protein PqqE [Hyphomicrobiaceae bacterium]
MTSTNSDQGHWSDQTCPTAPIGLLAELTHRCPLQCPYCSNPVQLEKRASELSTEQWLDIIDQAHRLGVLQLHLSGGEPTARDDLECLVERAAAHGIYSNLITAGVLLTRNRVQRLADIGLDHIQLSIQDVDPANADRISGYRGGQSKKEQVAGWIVEAGLPLTINAPIHRQNIANLSAMIDFAMSVGAERLEVAHVQYYGWGLLNRARFMPTRDQVRQSIATVEKARDRLKGRLRLDFVTPDYYAKRPKPCMGGWGRNIMNITPSGRILPCHAAETISHLSFDNVKDVGLRDAWLHSKSFNAFRGTAWMVEPCRSCDRREIDWGGCRCQALAILGDARATDPACALSPFHDDMRDIALGLQDEAETELIMRNPRNSLR